MIYSNKSLYKNKKKYKMQKSRIYILIAFFRTSVRFDALYLSVLRMLVNMQDGAFCEKIVYDLNP